MDILRLGPQTRWGRIGAVMWLDDGWYYRMDSGTSVSLLPESVVRMSLAKDKVTGLTFSPKDML